MIKTLKMTDITKNEVLALLEPVKFLASLDFELYENDVETVFKCDVDDSNKIVFAKAFNELKQFVYSDEDETPYDRLCSLVNIRGLKIGVIDQGFRGKLTEKLMSINCPVKYSLGFNSISDLNNYFDSVNLETSLESFADAFGLDVVVLGTAEIEGDGMISSFCKLFVWHSGYVAEKKYYFLGIADEIASKLSFLAAALIDKEIY